MTQRGQETCSCCTGSNICSRKRLQADRSMVGLLDLGCLEFIKHIENRLSSQGVFCFSEKRVLLHFCNMPQSKGSAILDSQGLFAGGQKTMSPFTCCASEVLLLRQGSPSQGEPLGSQPEEAESETVGKTWGGEGVCSRETTMRKG